MKRLFTKDFPLLALFLIIFQYNINTEYFVQKYPSGTLVVEREVFQKIKLEDNCSEFDLVCKTQYKLHPNYEDKWLKQVETQEILFYTNEKVNSNSRNPWNDNCADAKSDSYYKVLSINCIDKYSVNWIPFFILLLLFTTLIYLVYWKFNDD